MQYLNNDIFPQHKPSTIFMALRLLPRPQALIKKFHASHYMKGLHEVEHCDK
jgi:hypothetical protein